MTTIGMLSHRNDPKTVFKSYAYAAAAKMEGVEFFFFSPGRVNLKEKTILGWVYVMGEWIEKTVPFPDVIYNSSPPITEKQEAIVEALRQDIPFTSNPIGDKMSVYNRIKKDGNFSNYLIPSVDITKFDVVNDLLNEYQEIIVKPASGAKGIGIVYIQQEDDQYTIYQNQLKQVLTKIELKQFIENIIKNDAFLSQPFIQSKTNNGLSYDFRLHTQKDGEGQWTLTTIYPRIAGEGVVANLSGGGYSAIFESFLKHEFEEKFYDVKRTLEHFAVHFSTHFDGLYNEPLDELGIDIGIDANRKIWIFEVNWRPGPPILFSLEQDVTKRMIRYACYLQLQKARLMQS
ncbi:YheC/YheD family protein [Virgibacillus pantothenticus]|uniref:YheC/YheD family endospore coat-associated protein n=1 Tax=Virgibacillus pantothenticus TaxID=1473 RepID=UPI000984C36A|nr:YheC/YheD family protein [Virgibacillus pantothenticus]